MNRSAEAAAITVVAVSIVLGVGYLYGRFRLGDWRPARDALMMAWLALVAAVLVVVFQQPSDLVALVLSGALILGGGYLLATGSRDGARLTQLAGALALLSGSAGLVLEVIA